MNLPNDNSPFFSRCCRRSSQERFVSAIPSLPPFSPPLPPLVPSTAPDRAVLLNSLLLPAHFCPHPIIFPPERKCSSGFLFLPPPRPPNLTIAGDGVAPLAAGFPNPFPSSLYPFLPFVSATGPSYCSCCQGEPLLNLPSWFDSQNPFLSLCPRQHYVFLCLFIKDVRFLSQVIHPDFAAYFFMFLQLAFGPFRPIPPFCGIFFAYVRFLFGRHLSSCQCQSGAFSTSSNSYHSPLDPFLVSALFGIRIERCCPTAMP